LGLASGDLPRASVVHGSEAGLCDQLVVFKMHGRQVAESLASWRGAKFARCLPCCHTIPKYCRAVRRVPEDMARATASAAALLAALCALIVAATLVAAVPEDANSASCRFRCTFQRSQCCRSFARTNPCDGNAPPPGHPCFQGFIDCQQGCYAGTAGAAAYPPTGALLIAEDTAPAPAPHHL